jgi:hypothetical protein
LGSGSGREESHELTEPVAGAEAWLALSSGTETEKRLDGRFCGVADSGSIVGVDGGKGAEEQAVDVSKNGSAARGDVVLGEKLVEVAQGVVDAMGSLEPLRVPDERSIDVGGV